MEKTKNHTGLVISCLLVALALTTGSAQAASILGEEWEKFLTERVKFGGFVDNTTGLAIGPDGDRRHFKTSNRFIMERFTIQPEFNAQMTDWAKFFISWRFVKEPRYNAEARSRRKSVSYFPTAPVQPLPNTFYDEDSPKPWEAVLDILPTDRLAIRLGRQFISWGETDGLRLLDVINPQDSTFAPPVAPNLFDLDETRIPTWGIRMLYTAIPASSTTLELVALPGFEEAKQRVDEVVGSNDTRDGIVRYGRWSAHPETRLIIAGRNAFGNLYANSLSPASCAAPTIGCLVIPSTTRQLPDAGDNWKIGAKITHNIGKLNFGLGYIWGYNPQGADMVFKRKGAVTCSAPVAGPCLAGLAPSVVNLRLVNDRTHIFAGHFNYAVDEILSIPLNTAIRGEIAIYPQEPYNISEFPGRNCATGVLTGFRVGPRCKRGVEDSDSILEKNTLRYALGFDRSILIPFLQDDPWRAFRMSFQIFQRIILDHEHGIHLFSTAEKIKKVSNFLTFRVSTGYRGDTILPDLFVGYDPAGYWSFNPAVSYAPPWNEKIKLTLTAALYGGHNKFAFPGFFSEKDSVFLKMRYQF